METVYKGIITGSVISIVMNPIDLAIYRSVTNKRSFFTIENFKNPYSAFHLSFIHRVLSNGLYYTYQDNFRRMSSNPFIIGILSGTFNALTLNPILNLKYYMWRENKNAVKSIWEMNFKTYTKGGVVLCIRDIVFSCTYESLKKYDIFFASFMGIVLCSPFNYVRMQVYNSNEKVYIWKCLEKLITETLNHKNPITYLRYNLLLGIGAIRSSIGITLGQYLYNYL